MALIGALAIASPAQAQQAAPYKLIITWAQGGVAVVDYPSANRCEKGRSAVEQEAERRASQAPRQLPGGGMIIGSPWVAYAFCIPG